MAASGGRTYYEVLGVDPSADKNAIRKAYLKLSLKYHPDKTPDNIEEAKANFIAIGQAYEVLFDETKRAQYDRELRSGGGGARKSGFSTPSSSSPGFSGFGGGASSFAGSSSGMDGGFPFDDKAYEAYRNVFDETVAGMSEAELAACMGAAAAVAGVVGSIVGSRLLGGNKNAASGARSAGSGILSAAGSMVGSMVASQLASESVKALHEQSRERVAYQVECRRAVERGEPAPPPPQNRWNDIIGRTIGSVKNRPSVPTGGSNNNTGPGSEYQHQTQQDRSGNNYDNSGQQQQRQGGGFRASVQDQWNQKMGKAKEAAVAAAAAAAVASFLNPNGNDNGNSGQNQGGNDSRGGQQGNGQYGSNQQNFGHSNSNNARQSGSANDFWMNAAKTAAAGVGSVAAELLAQQQKQPQRNNNSGYQQQQRY